MSKQIQTAIVHTIATRYALTGLALWVFIHVTGA